MAPERPPWDRVLARLGPDLPPRAAARFGAEPGSLECVGRVANAVYGFRRAGSGGSAYLRIVHADLRGADEVAAAVDFLRHLHGAGAPVCEPLRSRDGRFVETLGRADEIFLATAVAAVPGEPLDACVPSPLLFRAWGRALGALHAASVTYPGDAHSYLTWPSLWEPVAARLDPADAGARAAHRRLDAWQAEVFPTLPWHLCHADYRAGNQHFDGERVWTFDFDEPLHAPLAWDLARPFLELAVRPRDERRALLASFGEGYASVRDWPPLWPGALPELLAAKALEMFAWSRTCWQGDVLPGGESRATWETRLRRLFESPPPW